MEVNYMIGDREIMDDVLTSQKHITGVYNTFSNECVSQKLKDDMVAILGEEHQMQFDVFSQMQTNGWYSPEAAQQPKVEQARMKFQGIAGSL